MNGAELLNQVETFLARFVAYPSEDARVAHVLWCAHAHLMDVWETTPRIAFLSPEPGSGKSRALEVTELLVPRALHAVNASPSALFRSVSNPAGLPVILYDEIDTVFGPKAKDNEDIRGLLNAGHRRGASALRCVIKGKEVETAEFPAYCAVALAGLDDLPDTIATRSVIVRMRRRAPHERVEPFRQRLHKAEGNGLRDELAEWAAAIESDLADVWPAMPDGIEDRNADVWESLLIVADAAGGEWPERARCSAVALVAGAQADRGASLGVRLLADIRRAFVAAGTDRIATDDLLSFLNGLDDAPWGDLRGKPLDSRSLSYRLRKYDIAPKNVRIGERVVKGYDSPALSDAWSRYLPALAAVSDESEIPLPPEPAFDPGEEVEPPLPLALADSTATAATALHPVTTDRDDCTPPDECQRRRAFGQGPCPVHRVTGLAVPA